MLKYVIESFWNPRIWLPSNVTWSDLSNEKIQYAEFRHLYYPLPMAIVILLIRYFLEKYIYSPFGIHLGIQHKHTKKIIESKELEEIYRRGIKITHEEIQQAASQTKMTERQIERWFRIRKSIDRPTTLTKFCETGFRFTYYTFSFVYGLVVLWDKSWLWNIDLCWIGIPHQGVSNDIWWYYMINLSLYWSLFVSQFSDVKHKDFWQMMTHHIATIILISVSWICNMFRIGSLVLVVHDCADVFLEGAKMANYAKYSKLCNTIFGIFFLVWIVTRLSLFPFWIIRSACFEAPFVIGIYPAYFMLDSLLFVLLALHILWTYLILKMVYNSLLVGKVEGDIRSSSEEEVEDLPENGVQVNGLKKTS